MTLRFRLIKTVLPLKSVAFKGGSGNEYDVEEVVATLLLESIARVLVDEENISREYSAKI